MVGHDNLEDYADAAIYDFENRDFAPDGPFYLELAQQVDRPVLELGCGTGRITLPLANAGVELTAVDAVAGMLALGQKKAGDLPVEWVKEDVRRLELGCQYGLIIATGAVFQHLLERTDQEDMLAGVRRHLEPGGRFVVDVHCPHPKNITEVAVEKLWDSYTDPAGRQIEIWGTEHYDHRRQIMHETAYRRWVDAAGQQVEKRARLAMRYIFPREMEALLHYNGFEVEQCFGDWAKSPPQEDGPTTIYVCKLRGSHLT